MIDRRAGYCGCGCGAPVTRRFLPGHDAKLKGRLLRIIRTSGDQALVEEARAALTELGWDRLMTAVQAQIGTGRKFGVEIELIHGSREVMAQALVAAGINAEVEGYSHTTRRHWKLVTDSSVGDQGYELVSPVLRGAAGMADLETVCRVLAEQGAKVNKSCGLHVHHDAADLAKTEIVDVAVSYSRMQDSVDAILAPSRRVADVGEMQQNSYCRSLSWRDIALLQESATIQDAASVIGRYKVVNLAAYSRIGTIEFRQHQGTVEFEKIGAWIRFGQALIEAVKRGESPQHRNDVLVADDAAYFTRRERRLAA